MSYSEEKSTIPHSSQTSVYLIWRLARRFIYIHVIYVYILWTLYTIRTIL